MTDLATLLAAHPDRFRQVIPFDLTIGGLVVFDFTDRSPDFAQIDINDVTGFTERLFVRIADAEIPVGIGRYNEDRVLYRHSPLFDGEAERRSVHLGIDLFVMEGTEVMTPLEGHVHSVADNRGLGNYGPTVIIEHELDETRFWTLYGHLGRHSVVRLELGQPLVAGEEFAEVGDLSENGSWPPHLHFQLIADLHGRSGDFPGVAAPSELDRWLEICPDPNLILGIPGLSAADAAG
jgi:murein DD-endopeptidase MepM/ murein hydrolase activator NlpD